jgi:tetratricopeptide (TPR) repeat protein
MAKWTAFPHDASGFAYDAAALKKHWTRLHTGDAERWPADATVVDAWRLFHAGEFQKAAEAGLKAAKAGSPGGLTVANKSQSVYATYLERSEKAKLALLLEVAERAEARTKDDPKDVAAHYNMAYALGRYSQGISIAKALAQGLGTKVKSALETTIKLEPKHADAHAALGAFHAEVIDKVGSLLARTQGASKDAGLAAYRQAVKLAPQSAIVLVEYANGLVMLEGEKRIAEATKLYEQAAAMKPMDAMETLDVEMAKAELEDD